MVFAPLRGIFFLGRTAFMIAAVAAVPVLLKKNKKLADQVGDGLVKAGERLKQEFGGADAVKAEAAPKADAARTSPSASKAKAPQRSKSATKVGNSPTPKKPSAKKVGTKATAKRSSARPKQSQPPAG